MASNLLTRDLTSREMVTLGVGIGGGALMLGAVVYAIQRQLEHGVKVKLTHEFSPEASRQVDELLVALAPFSEQIKDEGAVDVNLRLFSKRSAV